MNKVYACIDLKSFYASVECIERNLDPLTTNLVVADSSRTEKTICLAVSPSLKKYGIPGRVRLYEVVQKVNRINQNRKEKIYNKRFTKKSYNDIELEKNKNLKLDYIVAKPRMALYMKYSTKIYGIYLKYMSSQDIYVYSIDEVFCDITEYLKYNKTTPQEFITKILRDVVESTGITATAGIGTNLYLAKVAMDIVAKHKNADKYGVRIASLDEISYRKELWSHKPLTDFWRVGAGYQKRLEKEKIYTMGDIARTSIENEEILYKMFGVNAEILIDHAWGYEPCTMELIKKYKPKSNSISIGQVLQHAYNTNKAKIIVKEMIDQLSLELVKKNIVSDLIVINIGYDNKNISFYEGELEIDRYGRTIPKSSHGSIRLKDKTSSSKIMVENALKLYDQIIKEDLMVKRINVAFMNTIDKAIEEKKEHHEQIDIFTNIEDYEDKIKKEELDNENETILQNIMLNIKEKYGKNSILKAMNLEQGATAIERNKMIGGHHE